MKVMKVVQIPLYLPTPLRKTPRIHHISSMEHASFEPEPVTPQNTCHKLHPDQYADDHYAFSSTDDNTPHIPRSTPASTPEYSEDEEEEEDFQMVPLNNDHWTSEEIPERTLCIHEHGLPHGLCPYPCPYANYTLRIIWSHPAMKTYWHSKLCLIERHFGLI